MHIGQLGCVSRYPGRSTLIPTHERRTEDDGKVRDTHFVMTLAGLYSVLLGKVSIGNGYNGIQQRQSSTAMTPKAKSRLRTPTCPNGTSGI
ncbi:hypothetical protein BC938DRAFT_479168 [Jimgerdemannia flammicorona]|uniref:Uncharacterized protein n=1 Tax=Jimgerdemannia flammicorona TaxID=994334 RepID=A0A433QLF1_9FUNG|nr:hypothetical protein BC938DRAFT_479168 [Jimgerdemannia flammicorona]